MIRWKIISRGIFKERFHFLVQISTLWRTAYIITNFNKMNGLLNIGYVNFHSINFLLKQEFLKTKCFLKKNNCARKNKIIYSTYMAIFTRDDNIGAKTMKIKKKSDRPTLCQFCYATPNTFIHIGLYCHICLFHWLIITQAYL